MKSVNSTQLERWFGPECTQTLVDSAKGWYGPPLRIANVPGVLYAHGDGGFTGRLIGGSFAGVVDWFWEKQQKLRRGLRRATSGDKLHMGFASLSDLISEASNGKQQDLLFQKSPTTASTAGNAMSCWNFGVLPVAGGVGGTSGTGRACTSATTGALTFQNPAAGDTTHVTTVTIQATATSSLLLYDRLWDMTYNHATATTTAIDAANRPTRYQTATTSPGNFISGEITTALSATAHNLTVTYVDQDNNTAEAAATYAAPVSAVVGRSPTVAGQWFVPLNSPDTGVRYLTNIAQSTITSVTGVTNWWIGKALVLVPIPIANVPFVYDGINSAFSLVQVQNSACLAFTTPAVANAATITYNGIVKLVSG